MVRIWKDDFRDFPGLILWFANNRYSCREYKNYFIFYGLEDPYLECTQFEKQEKDFLNDLDHALGFIDYSNSIRIKYMITRGENKMSIEDIIKKIYSSLNYPSYHLHHQNLIRSIT